MLSLDYEEPDCCSSELDSAGGDSVGGISVEGQRLSISYSTASSQVHAQLMPESFYGNWVHLWPFHYNLSIYFLTLWTWLT